MTKEFNVLSLFDGMSCGQIALQRAKIKYDNYFASEIDKYAIIVTQANYPNTIQLGDVTKVRSNKLPQIDLLLGGSPCQGFSFAGKGLAFDDPRSKLFFQYIRLLKSIRKTNPKVKFLLENVRMKKEHLDVITKLLGVEPITINSNLVSAQNRFRYYWTNIQDVDQPKDKKIYLNNILEDRLNNIARVVGRRINPKTRKRDDYNLDLPINQRIEPRLDNKCGTLTTVQKDNVVLLNYLKDFKVPNTPSRHMMWKKGCKNITNENKSSCLTTKMDRWANAGLIQFEDFCRFLTVIEAERLQTVADNYTNHVNKNNRYFMLGNGWTVDVISHIFRAMKKEWINNTILKRDLHYYKPSLNTSIV